MKDKIAQAIEMVKQNNNFGEVTSVKSTIKPYTAPAIKTTFAKGTPAADMFQREWSHINTIARELEETEEKRSSGEYYNCRVKEEGLHCGAEEFDPEEDIKDLPSLPYGFHYYF